MDAIIEELKQKGKYEEWLSYGGLYGLISCEINAKYFKIRPYTYYDVNGDIIRVSMVQSTYRTDATNIPVFKHYTFDDKSHIGQDELKFVDINDTLYTHGLATCCGLTMTIGNKKMLTHITACTNVSKKIYDIRVVIDDLCLQDIIPSNVIIYAGDLDNHLSFSKANKICKQLHILEENIIIHKVNKMDRISI